MRIAVGNGLRADIWQEFQQRFGIPRIGEFYGATEGNVATLNRDNTVGSVGRLLWGGVLARWDEERGEFVRGADGFLVRCKPGEVGVLLGRIARRTQFEGYQRRGETERKIIRNAFKRGDAWFNTGDLLRIDDAAPLVLRRSARRYVPLEGRERLDLRGRRNSSRAGRSPPRSTCTA